MRFDLPRQFDGARIVSSQVSDGAMNARSGGFECRLGVFLKKIGAAGKPFCFASQPHGKAIAVVRRGGRAAGADGLLARGDLILGVKSADCVPLLLCERRSGLIGAIHVSRKNLLGGIVSGSLDAKFKGLGADRSRLAAFLGPHIRVENYPLNQAGLDQIKGTRWERFLAARDGKECFDLTRAVVGELEKIGVKRENILDSRLDTFSDKRFFSARGLARGEELKVFLTVIFRA